MLKFTVKDSRCVRCGLCASDCPAGIIEQHGKILPFIAPAREEECIQCQHCLAICPSGAISIFGKNPDESDKWGPHDLPKFEQMCRFMRGRRSIRHYKDENVDPELIRKLLASVANCPTGVNRRELTFNVIDDKEVMRKFRNKVLTMLKEAGQTGRISSQFSYLTDAVPAYYEHGKDILFRGAPHAIIITAPPDAPCPREDVTLALAYFELLAQSAGLGTVWWGMLKMVLETMPELKPLVGLQKKHVYYGMLFGVPSVHFARTVQRDDAAIVKRISF